MAIFSGLNIAENGLRSQANRLSAASQNVANANTVGYKETTPLFWEMVTNDSSTLGATFNGASSTMRQQISRQGQVARTDSPTDMAIAGDGFFAVTSNVADTNAPLYTRAGSFTPDGSGNMRNAAGFYLLGWALSANGLADSLSGGSISADVGAAALTPVNVQQLIGTDIPTSLVAFRANLNASAIAYAGTYDAASSTANMTSGVVAPNFTHNIEVVDSGGEVHNLAASFLKLDNNQWAVELHGSPSSAVAGGNGLVANGTLTFNGDATLNAVSDGISQPFSISWANGETNTITMDWGTAGPIFGTAGATTFGRADGMSQFDDTSALKDITQDGHSTAQLREISINRQGILTATYRDGTVQRLYQIPLVNFTNPDQLATANGNVFYETNLTSAALYGIPGQGFAGDVQSSSLEQSNVDMSEQITDIVIAQRAYQSNTKLITAYDEMLQQAAQMAS